MNTNYNKYEEIQSAFDQMFNNLSEEDLLDIDAKILMFRFLSLIDAKREELGWSRKDLALQIKTSPSFISQLFQGDKLINFTTLAKIQRAMGLEFEITQKRTYAGKVLPYAPRIEGGKAWNYMSIDKCENNTCELIPLAV
jgi:ribosome-binding protein aMBF1 (putative translation factor)